MPISREDAAEVAVRALGRTPSNGKGLLFQVLIIHSNITIKL